MEDELEAAKAAADAGKQLAMAMERNLRKLDFDLLRPEYLAFWDAYERLDSVRH